MDILLRILFIAVMLAIALVVITSSDLHRVYQDHLDSQDSGEE